MTNSEAQNMQNIGDGLDRMLANLANVEVAAESLGEETALSLAYELQAQAKVVQAAIGQMDATARRLKAEILRLEQIDRLDKSLAQD